MIVRVSRGYAEKNALAKKRNRPKSSLKHRETKLFRLRVKKAIQGTKEKGNPVAKYDLTRKAVYLEYPDGRKEYVERE